MTEKELLKKLGIWPNLNGIQYLLKGFELIRENSDYLQCVTKRLYPDIGKAYKARWPSVERAIRTCVISCWERGNRDFLNEMAGYPLRERPTVSEFFRSHGYICAGRNRKRGTERPETVKMDKCIDFTGTVCYAYSR